MTLLASSLSTVINSIFLEYRDLFIDMAVRNNRSELAIANRHQEQQNLSKNHRLRFLIGRTMFFHCENLSI